ncbi:MAG: hypothetical protein R2881_02195 [Eubacteriales bacterium]
MAQFLFDGAGERSLAQRKLVRNQLGNSDAFYRAALHGAVRLDAQFDPDSGCRLVDLCLRQDLANNNPILLSGDGARAVPVLSFPYISLYDYAIFGIPFTLLFFDLVEKREQAFHPFALLLLWILPMICLFLFVKTNIQLLPFVLMGYMIALVVKTSKQSAIETLVLNPSASPAKD